MRPNDDDLDAPDVDGCVVRSRFQSSLSKPSFPKIPPSFFHSPELSLALECAVNVLCNETTVCCEALRVCEPSGDIEGGMGLITACEGYDCGGGLSLRGEGSCVVIVGTTTAAADGARARAGEVTGVVSRLSGGSAGGLSRFHGRRECLVDATVDPDARSALEGEVAAVVPDDDDDADKRKVDGERRSVCGLPAMDDDASDDFESFAAFDDARKRPKRPMAAKSNGFADGRLGGGEVVGRG